MTTGLLIAAGHGEAKLSAGFARAAAAVLGGNAADHHTAGRLASFATIAAAGWGAVTLVNRKLAVGGSAPGQRQPVGPRLSGDRRSGVVDPLGEAIARASRWLREVRPSRSPRSCGARQTAHPGLRVPGQCPDRGRRADLLLAGSTAPRPGPVGVRVVLPHRFGLHQLRGDRDAGYGPAATAPRPASGTRCCPRRCHSTRVTLGTRQTRMVVNGIVERLLLARAPEKRQVRPVRRKPGFAGQPGDVRGQGITGPAGISLDAAVWIGTPNATKWRAGVVRGDRTVSQVPPVGPGAVYLSRAVRDWRRLSPEQRAGVRYLLLPERR